MHNCRHLLSVQVGQCPTARGGSKMQYQYALRGGAGKLQFVLESSSKHLQWCLECWHGGGKTPSQFYDAGALEAPNDIGWQKCLPEKLGRLSRECSGGSYQA